MSNKYDLTILEDLTEGEISGLHSLSPETVQLCLMALDDRAIFQGAWWDDGDNITGARWDVAEGHVQQAKAELIASLATIDGGYA